MQIETHNQLGKPLRVECTRLVIRDVNNTPVAVAMQQTPDHIFIMHAGEKGFATALRNMGIHDTVIVDRIGNEELPSPPGKLLLPSEA